jgi:hypothetical protein
MNQNVPDRESSEIDLNQLGRKIGNLFNNFGYSVFNAIQFFIKHGIAIVLLFILGLGAGLYLNKYQKNYSHKIIVLPNFNSTEYLYSKINLLNVKIKENDTTFLKSIGIKDSRSLKKIEIKAIVDPYAFVKNNENNLEMLKLIAEDGSMEKVLEGDMTSMKYEYHQILFSTNDSITMENTINPIMNFLNNNDYFKVIQEKVIANIKNKITYTEQTLNQVNGILDNFSNGAKNNGTDSKLMYYNNENSQIDDILKTKNTLIIELGYFKIELINTQKIIKDLSIIQNVQKETSTPVILPGLFVGLYILVVLFVRFYKKQKLRRKNEITV